MFTLAGKRTLDLCEVILYTRSLTQSEMTGGRKAQLLRRSRLSSGGISHPYPSFHCLSIVGNDRSRNGIRYFATITNSSDR